MYKTRKKIFCESFHTKVCSLKLFAVFRCLYQDYILGKFYIKQFDLKFNFKTRLKLTKKLFKKV